MQRSGWIIPVLKSPCCHWDLEYRAGGRSKGQRAGALGGDCSPPLHRQDPWCWEPSGLHKRALRGGGFLSLLSTQVQSNSTYQVPPWAAPLVLCHGCGSSSCPLHSPCFQTASSQLFITIVICLKCKLGRIMLQLKIVQCLPLPSTTQHQVPFLHPDFPLCLFNHNSC